jgi:hypothetical protein
VSASNRTRVVSNPVVSSGLMRRPFAATWQAAVLFLALVAIYNSNGREIGSYDSQPAKFAALAVAERGSMTLDPLIQRVPQYAERSAFARDRFGHYRSAYSPVPILFGGATAWLMATLLRVDLDAPLAANFVAAFTASLLTACAVVLVFLTVQPLTRPSVALWVAVGLGLGTNYWGMVSRTLGQHESVALGLAIALFAWTRPTSEIRASHRSWGALGLAVASTARLQTLPIAIVLLGGLARRVGWRAALAPAALVAAIVLALAGLQFYWFGSPLGAVPQLESLHPTIHAVTGSVSTTPWIGAAGLLVSPSRGLLVYSPIVLIALAGLVIKAPVSRDRGIGWLSGAAAVQFCVYATYSVWWGGHTFGPRYLLDVLVLLTPSAAVAADSLMRSRPGRAACALALAWSLVVAATGAFFSDPWNTSPDDVDRHHERLWEWRDPQILRAWHAGLSPQNFDLFDRASVRKVS